MDSKEVPQAEQRKLPSYDVPPTPVPVTVSVDPSKQPPLAAYDVPPFAIPVNPRKVSQAGYDFPPFAMPVKPGDSGGGSGEPEAKRLVPAVSRMDSEAERCYAVPPTAVPVNSRNFGQESGDGAPQVSRTDSQQDGGPQGYALPPTAIPSSSMGLPAVKEAKADGSQKDSSTAATRMGSLSETSSGLECLAEIDHLFLKELKELRKADPLGSERKKSYEILNSKRHLLFNAEESPDSEFVRMFKIAVTDAGQCQVMCFYRTVYNSCFPFRLQSMEAFSEPGKLVGRVEQKLSLWNPQFLVKNENGETFGKIKGTSCSNRNLEFEIHLFKDGDVPKGKICKKWDDLLAPESTLTPDADSFGFNFPGDLDLNLKIVLIGASFLIKFLYFEKK